VLRVVSAKVIHEAREALFTDGLVAASRPQETHAHVNRVGPRVRDLQIQDSAASGQKEIVAQAAREKLNLRTHLSLVGLETERKLAPPDRDIRFCSGLRCVGGIGRRPRPARRPERRQKERDNSPKLAW